MEKHELFMKRAIELSQIGMDKGAGGPFGCVIVKNGEIIAEGHNQVLHQNDPTAHAEIVAIRAACLKLGSFQLTDCELYTSCEPCPMCLGAIYWARPKAIYYANSKEEAAAIGFDDDFIYRQMDVRPESRAIPQIRMYSEEALLPFIKWQENKSKTRY